MKKNIAVIGGGFSSEAEVSLRSVATVYQHFDREKHTPYKVLILSENDWFVELENQKIAIDKNDFSFTLEGKKIKFDYAFIVIHGTPGEDGKLQGYFDMLKIPYNTCGQLASTLTFDKWVCISLAKQLGFPTANSLVFRKGEQTDASKIITELGLPVFVKPTDAGSSYGVSKVSEESKLELAIKNALDHGTAVLIESELKGTEVTCGIYERPTKELRILGITEVVSENDFFDYEAKYKGKAVEITPARIPADVATQIELYTKQIYRALGMKGMSRIDFIIKNNIPYLLEVNTTPGMTEASFIPQQVKYSQMQLKDFFNEIIETTSVQ